MKREILCSETHTIVLKVLWFTAVMYGTNYGTKYVKYIRKQLNATNQIEVNLGKIYKNGKNTIGLCYTKENFFVILLSCDFVRKIQNVKFVKSHLK